MPFFSEADASSRCKASQSNAHPAPAAWALLPVAGDWLKQWLGNASSHPHQHEVAHGNLDPAPGHAVKDPPKLVADISNTHQCKRPSEAHSVGPSKHGLHPIRGAASAARPIRGAASAARLRPAQLPGGDA